MGDETEEAAILAERPYQREESFEELYRRFYGKLVGYCRARIGPEGAEDVAQEAFLRAFRYLGGYDGSRPIWPWLKAIARNVASDRADRTGRETAVGEPFTVACAAPSPEDGLVIRRALRGLSPKHRAALRLRYLEGWEPRAAAASLGLSVAAFNQLVFRARARLRSELRRMGERVPGILGAPLAWLRSRFHRSVTRVSHASGSASGTLALAGDALLQLAGGLVAVLLIAGMPPASGQPARDAQPRAAASPVTVHDPVGVARDDQPPGKARAEHARTLPAQDGSRGPQEDRGDQGHQPSAPKDGGGSARVSPVPGIVGEVVGDVRERTPEKVGGRKGPVMIQKPDLPDPPPVVERIPVPDVVPEPPPVAPPPLPVDPGSLIP